MNKTIIYISKIDPLKDESLFFKYYNLMPDYRKNKIDRYEFIESKLLSLGAGILLKKACLDNNIKEEDKNIYLNEYGKPFFSNSNLYFSISHSKEMVACAISDKEVGMDIEYITEPKLKVMARVFNELEIADFNTESKEGFYSLWTLKESYLKKLGKGLYMDPKKILFNVDLKVKNDIITKFYQNKVDNYMLSCAYENEKIKIENVDLDKFILELLDFK